LAFFLIASSAASHKTSAGQTVFPVCDANMAGEVEQALVTALGRQQRRITIIDTTTLPWVQSTRPRGARRFSYNSIIFSILSME
jgi:hypothetical protein